MNRSEDGPKRSARFQRTRGLLRKVFPTGKTASEPQQPQSLESSLVNNFLEYRIRKVDWFRNRKFEPKDFITLLADEEVPFISKSGKKEIVRRLYAHLEVEVPPELGQEEIERLLLTRQQDPDSRNQFEIHDITRQAIVTTRTPVSPDLEIQRQITFKWGDQHLDMHSARTRHILIRTE